MSLESSINKVINNTSLSSLLKRAIIDQLTLRTKVDSSNNIICRHCDKKIPDDMLFVLQLPGQEDRVWGPCCSDECLCYLKVCQGCNKDFVIDKPGEIKFVGEKEWLCKDCRSHIEGCSVCGRGSALRMTDEGKMCSECYKQKFFTCSTCNSECSNNIEVLAKDRVCFTHVVDGNSRVCNICYPKLIKDVKPLRVKTCKCCNGTYAYRRDMGHSYCPICIKANRVRKCSHCTKYVHEFKNKNGSVYGTSCCYHKFSNCEVCGIFSLKSSLTKEKHTLCTVRVCKDCSQDMKQVIECPKCFEIQSKERFDRVGCTRCNHAICPRCNQSHHGERTCRRINFERSEYSFKPVPHFHYVNSNDKKVFFGFENEISYGTELDYRYAMRTIYDCYKANEVYIKSDSTISGHGFECVTHPMSPNYFKVMDLSPLFSEGIVMNRDMGCGLHIHFSKKSFDGDAHLYKFVNFINTQPLTIKVAGRTFNDSYCNQYRKEDISKVIKGSKSRERMYSVNLTSKNTYEVRIFKGAVTETELRYRIEFAIALIEFTRNEGITQCNEDNFIQWIKNNKKEYKFLYAFLNSEG